MSKAGLPPKRKMAVVLIAFLILFILHKDFFFADDPTLWFGYLPAGLGYQMLFSCVAALFWYWVSQWAWPDNLEDIEYVGDTAPKVVQDDGPLYTITPPERATFRLKTRRT